MNFSFFQKVFSFLLGALFFPFMFLDFRPVQFLFVATIVCSSLPLIDGIRDKNIDWKAVLRPWKILYLLFLPLFTVLFLWALADSL